MTSPRIFVSAAVITDVEGRVLVVRKHGTSVFMQPGGKPETGESAAEALARELHEEVGLVVQPDALEPLGTFEADAANEPGHRVVAAAFRVAAEPGAVSARAEIAEAALDHSRRRLDDGAGSAEPGLPARARLGLSRRAAVSRRRC